MLSFCKVLPKNRTNKQFVILNAVVSLPHPYSSSFPMGRMFLSDQDPPWLQIVACFTVFNFMTYTCRILWPQNTNTTNNCSWSLSSRSAIILWFEPKQLGKTLSLSEFRMNNVGATQINILHRTRRGDDMWWCGEGKTTNYTKMQTVQRMVAGCTSHYKSSRCEVDDSLRPKWKQYFVT